MNIIDRILAQFVKNRDVWLKAREITARLPVDETLFEAVPSLVAADHGLIVDLNKYRPGRSLEKMLKAGVSGFILRMGGPTQWVEGAWNYQEDATWRGYMDQAKALGIVNQIGGYYIHNAFEDWHLQGIISNTHMNLVNQWTSGGYMPGYIICDHEINYCYRGATKIIVTDVNLVESLKSLTDQTWKIFKKVPLIYSARWFIDQNGPALHATFLDNINVVEKQRPMWYAWYPQTLTKTYQNAAEILNEITPPTSTQVAKYLQCGSYSLADLVQFTDRLKLKGVMADGTDDAVGVDASYTWGTWAQFCAAVNIPEGAVTPPPDDGNPPPTDTTLEARVTALETWGRSINFKG